jgi:hypothetical protein
LAQWKFEARAVAFLFLKALVQCYGARTEKEQHDWKKARTEATNRERKGCDVIHNLGCFRIAHLSASEKAMGKKSSRISLLFFSALLARVWAGDVRYRRIRRAILYNN